MKKILIPTLLATCVAPIATLVSCNKSNINIVLDDWYGDVGFCGFICTKQTYQLKAGARYSFTVDMTKWDKEQQWDHLTFILSDGEISDGGKVELTKDFKFITDNGTDVTGILSEDVYEEKKFYHKNIDFINTEKQKILDCNSLTCYITVSPTAVLEGEYYFTLFGSKT